MSARRRLASAARWLAPSVAAACLAAAVAGVAENLGQGLGGVGTIAAAGFASLLAAPVCLVLALFVRGLWAAWRPAALAERVLEDGGGAPRLAGWIGFLLFGAFILSWATFNGVRILSRVSSFKVNVVALTLPIVVIVAATLLTALSRPLVDLIAAVVRRADARARARFGRSLATPRVIFAGTVVAIGVLLVIAWFVTVRPRIGPLDIDIVRHPLIALGLTSALHPAWRRLRPRRAALAIGVPAAVASLAMAAAVLVVRLDRAALMLEIWSQPTVAGLAVETLFDVDDLRNAATLQRYRPAPRAGAAHRDVILITIDTVRYDRTPLGKGPASMPTLAALAARGTSFAWAFSPSNVTRRSIPAMILGLSSPRVRGRVVGWALRLDPRHVPVGERLAAAGYDTAGFFCCGSFWEPSKKTGYSRGIDHVVIDSDGDVLTSEATTWLAERYAQPHDRPLFVWMHYIEPHNWMKRKDEGGKGATDSRHRRYDKALADVDGFLGRIVATLDAIPEDRRPIVIVTSDHGEGLGDHGQPFHSSDLYDSQTHVPFVVVVPGAEPRIVDETVSLTDLTPTLLDLAGFVPPDMPDMDGRSVADLVRGERVGDPQGGTAYAAMITDRSTSESARAVVKGVWKLIDGPHGLELYDTRADPKEAKNLVDEQPAVVAELKAMLAERARIDATSPFPRWSSP